MSDLLTLNNVFLTVGLVSTLLYIIKMVLYFLVGGDTEVDASFDTMTETDISFNFISVQSILAFLMGFGWSGLAALLQFQWGGTWSLITGILVGSLFMYLSALLMYSIKKLNKTIKLDINELVGVKGRAYSAFAPKAKGQIEIVFNEKLSVLDAYNLTEEEIKAFSEIKVEKIEDGQIYITKI